MAKLDRITQGMLRDYKNCPELFYYRHVLKLKLPEKHINLLFGGAIHKGIEAYHNSNIPARAHKAFEKEFDFEMLSSDEKLEYKWHVDEGHRLIDRYIEAQDYLEKVHGISKEGVSEGYFKVMWKDPYSDEELGIPITGIIDRRVKGNKLIDFKTSSKPYKQKDADDKDQATIYSYSGELLYGEEVPEFIYVVLIKGRKEPIQVVRTKRSKADFAYTFREIKSVIKRIESGKFDRGCTGYKAKWCDCGKYREHLNINV